MKVRADERNYFYQHPCEVAEQVRKKRKAAKRGGGWETGEWGEGEGRRGEVRLGNKPPRAREGTFFILNLQSELFSEPCGDFVLNEVTAFPPTKRNAKSGRPPAGASRHTEALTMVGRRVVRLFFSRGITHV